MDILLSVGFISIYAESGRLIGIDVSTTASILASSLLRVAKHGAKASSSKTGAADLLHALEPSPNIEMVTAEKVPEAFEKEGNYVLLSAGIFHPGMRYAAPIRKSFGTPTIYNTLGPLANTAYPLVEAGVYGVAKPSLGRMYAEVLRISGSKKARMTGVFHKA